MAQERWDVSRHPQKSPQPFRSACHVAVSAPAAGSCPEPGALLPGPGLPREPLTITSLLAKPISLQVAGEVDAINPPFPQPQPRNQRCSTLPGMAEKGCWGPRSPPSLRLGAGVLIPPLAQGLTERGLLSDGSC